MAPLLPALPSCWVVAFGLQQIGGPAVERKLGVLQHDRRTGVGEVEHRPRLDGARQGGIDRLEARRVATRRVGVARRGLVDDHAVCHRVAARRARLGGRELGVPDGNHVRALHAGDLAARRRARGAVDFNRARGIDERRARPGRVEVAARDRHVAAAAVGCRRGAVVALGGDVGVFGDDRAAVGGVEPAGVVGGRFDAHVARVRRRPVGREDPVRPLRRGGEGRITHGRRRRVAHGEQDRVGSVEVAGVVVRAVARLLQGAAFDDEAAAVLRQGRVPVGVCFGNRLVGRGCARAVGRLLGGIRAGIVERGRIGPAARRPARGGGGRRRLAVARGGAAVGRRLAARVGRGRLLRLRCIARSLRLHVVGERPDGHGAQRERKRHRRCGELRCGARAHRKRAVGTVAWIGCTCHVDPSSHIASIRKAYAPTLNGP